MFWPPHLKKVIKVHESIITELCKEISNYDCYIEGKMKDVGFADWEINGKDGAVPYIPSAEDRIDLLVDKIKEYEKEQTEVVNYPQAKDLWASKSEWFIFLNIS